jgi:5-methylcytosine-specific restriction endonuclease McrA
MSQKRKMPTKGDIVNYWIKWETDKKQIPPWGDWDWGEPACMACTRWLEGWDDPETIRGKWNSTKGLERCHVIPRYLGGTDDVSNLVLMCPKCHQNQPDDLDPEITYMYMRERSSFSHITFPEGINYLKSQGITL